jgi:hypothetical protein
MRKSFVAAIAAVAMFAGMTLASCGSKTEEAPAEEAIETVEEVAEEVAPADSCGCDTCACGATTPDSCQCAK